MSLELFMRELLGSNAQAEIQIVSDNAKMPSSWLLATQARDPFMNSMYSSDCSQDSKQRKINRYHSEPIMIESLHESTMTPCRWAPTPLHQQMDPRLVVPKRTKDRWGVSRNHSDSSLMKAPKRTNCMPVTSSVLSTLQRKCSASKVISEMAHSSRMRQQQLKLPAFEDEIIEDPESIIEQLIEIPDEKRRQREGDERFIRSILQTPDITYEEESRPPGAIRRMFDLLQAILGIFIIIFKVISLELVGPAVRNSTSQLLHTLLVAIPMSESNEESRELILPLFRAQEDYGSTGSKAPSTTSNEIIPRILQRQDSWAHVNRSEATIL